MTITIENSHTSGEVGIEPDHGIWHIDIFES